LAAAFLSEAPARWAEGLRIFVSTARERITQETNMHIESEISSTGHRTSSDSHRRYYEACLWDGLNVDMGYLLRPKGLERSRKFQIHSLHGPAYCGSATAQHVMGILMLHAACESVDYSKGDWLDAAREIRKAAMVGVMESQFELGELFRHGLFCDVHMRFARYYIRRASRQGHVEATARMKELRTCELCGADDAPLACARCHQARYCDAACSGKHWCEGGGVGGGAGGFADLPHKTRCPRTHKRRSESFKSAKEATKEAANRNISERVPRNGLFCKAQCPKIVAANPALTLGEVGKALDAAWYATADADKASYKE
jgi:hypothetical protein